MLNKKLHLALIYLTASFLAIPIYAEKKSFWDKGNPNHFGTASYLKRTWNDFTEMPSKPFHWNKKEWFIAGSVIGLSFASFIVDDSIRDYYENNRNEFLTSVSDATTHFGDYKQQLPLMAGMWIIGTATKNETLQKIVADGAQASLFAAGIVTPMLVYCTGRDLPNAGENAMKFKPFTTDRYAYPSGHTTEAFAMATVLDQNLRKHFGYWQTPFLYAIALGTAHSRIYDHTHYLSDVILGAGIGWSVGYWISNKQRNVDGNVWILPSTNGAKVVYRF